MESTTEKDSLYNDLEKMPVAALLRGINEQDQTVAKSVETAIPQIESLVNRLCEGLKQGGRLFYIGSGTSGRLGVVDASEIPPTFGMEPGIVVGLIAGGDKAIRKAQEGAEDDLNAAAEDLAAYMPDEKDFVIGISASGTTPYVIGGLKWCKEMGIPSGCIVCNENSPIAALADYPVEIVTGPEFVTGSTRMKAGTAQKMALNMISTAAMIQLGRVQGNKMVDMQLSNVKLVERGTRMLMQLYGIDYAFAKHTLLQCGSVRRAILHLENG